MKNSLIGIIIIWLVVNTALILSFNRKSIEKSYELKINSVLSNFLLPGKLKNFEDYFRSQRILVGGIFLILNTLFILYVISLLNIVNLH